MESKCISRKVTCNKLAVQKLHIGSLRITNGIILARQQDKTAMTRMLTVISSAGAPVATIMVLYATNRGAHRKHIATITRTAVTVIIFMTRQAKLTGACWRRSVGRRALKRPDGTRSGQLIKTAWNILASMLSRRLFDSLLCIAKSCRQCEKNTLRKIFFFKIVWKSQNVLANLHICCIFASEFETKLTSIVKLI